MTSILEKVRGELLALSSQDRAFLANELLTSLEEAAEDGPAAIKAAWTKEIQRRRMEIESGSVVGIDGDDVMTEMDKLFP